MAFCGKVHDGLYAAIGYQPFDKGRVADVAFNQVHTEPRQIGGITGIGQRIQHGDPVIGMMRSPVVDEIGAYEPGAASDEQFSHAILLP